MRTLRKKPAGLPFLAGLLFPACLCLVTPAAQETAGGGTAAAVPESAAGGDEGIPRQFRGFSLGMELAGLKEALQKDSLFRFRGDRDVSMLPVRRQTLVEAAGNPAARPAFIKQAFFQLTEDGRLFSMAFVLDTQAVSHYSVFTAFTRKYGEPDTLSPRQAVWERERTRVTIERPLTVKYLDRETLRSQPGGTAAPPPEVSTQENFLNDF